MWEDCTKAQSLVPAQKFLCKTKKEKQARLEGVGRGWEGFGRGWKGLWCCKMVTALSGQQFREKLRPSDSKYWISHMHWRLRNHANYLFSILRPSCDCWRQSFGLWTGSSILCCCSMLQPLFFHGCQTEAAEILKKLCLCPECTTGGFAQLQSHHVATSLPHCSRRLHFPSFSKLNRSFACSNDCFGSVALLPSVVAKSNLGTWWVSQSTRPYFVEREALHTTLDKPAIL